MSPSLFVLVMELFAKVVRKEIVQGNFKLHHRCKDPNMIHLAFADDLIAFLNGDRGTIECFSRVLQEFRSCTGLEANKMKSQFLCASMTDTQIAEAAQITDFKWGNCM